MNVEDALYHVVHDYPGGAPALAPRMGLNESVLSHMADPRDDRHGWPLKRFRQALTLTGDLRPLHALCAENGGVFVATGRYALISDRALLETVTQMSKEFGDVGAALHEMLSDGRIQRREYENLKKQVYELNQAAAELVERVGQLIEPEKAPAPVRAVK